jgi:uncharacterized membrane protein
LVASPRLEALAEASRLAPAGEATEMTAFLHHLVAGLFIALAGMWVLIGYHGVDARQSVGRTYAKAFAALAMAATLIAAALSVN